MIKIYTTPSCASCKKVKKFFDEQKIPYVEKNIFVSSLNEEELKDILSKSENGTEDIISNRSKIIKDQKIDIDSMSIKELIQFVRKNPSVLKRPIMVDERRMQVGYNEDEITVFIPYAQHLARESCNMDCEDYSSCDFISDSPLEE